MERDQSRPQTPPAAYMDDATGFREIDNNMDSAVSTHMMSWPMKLIVGLRHRAIDLQTLPQWLRILYWLIIGQLILVGILVGFNAISQPRVVVDTQPNGVVEVPITVFVVGLILLLLGWSTLLAAAFRSYWPLRMLAIGAFTFVFGGKPIVGLITQYTQLDPALRLLSWVDTGLIALVWGVGLGIWVREILWHTKNLPVKVNDFPWRSFCFVLAILLVYYAIAAWYAFIVGSHQYVAFFPKMVTAPLGLASALLIPLPFIAATDYAEFGAKLSEQAATMLRRVGSPWFIFALTTIVTFGVVTRVVIEIRPSGPHGAGLSLSAYILGYFVVLIFGAVVAALAAGLLFLITRIGRTEDWPDLQIPYTALIIAALIAVLGGIFTVLAGPGALWVTALGGSLALGVVLLARGRQRASSSAVTGLFLILFALFSLTGNVIHMIVGPASLIVLLWLALRGRVNQDTAPFITLLFTLNGGLLVLSWVDTAYGSPQYQTAITLTQKFTPVQALLIVGALLWGFAMSGRSSINVDSHKMYREVRVLMYIGYIMLASTSAMYFAAQTTAVSNSLQPSLGSAGDNFAQLGITMLGIPFLLASFALGVSRWRGERSRAAPAVQEQKVALPLYAGQAGHNNAAMPDGLLASSAALNTTSIDFAKSASSPHTPLNRRLIWHYGAVGWICLAPLYLLSIAYPAAEVALHHGTSTVAIQEDYLALTSIMFIVSAIVYWYVGRATAKAVARVGPGVLAALLSGGFGWITFIVANTLIAIPQQHPLVSSAISGSSSLNAVSSAIVVVVVWLFLAIVLCIQSAGTAALAGWLGAISGKRAAKS